MEPTSIPGFQTPVTVLVTGGTGFFGHNLVKQLLADPQIREIRVYSRNPPPTENQLSRVTVIDKNGFSLATEPGDPDVLDREPLSQKQAVSRSNRPNAIFEDERVHLFHGDITDKEKLAEAMKGCEVVFHACGDTSWWSRQYASQRRTNVDGTKTVYDLARKLGVSRLIHTSTVDVMGHSPAESDPRLLGTTDGISERWPIEVYSYDKFGYNYADTKREAERWLLGEAKKLSGGLVVTVIRPGSMIGPWDVSNQYGRLFLDLKTGNVPGTPCGGTSVCHVEDVARAHIVAATLPAEKVRSKVFICAGQNVTYWDLFAEMKRHLHTEKSWVELPFFVFPAFLLVLYAFLCELYADWWSEKHPDINPGMARYMSCHAYYSSENARKTLGYNTAETRWLDAVSDSYEWYRVRGRL